jgi:FkbM family methyltransferase
MPKRVINKILFHFKNKTLINVIKARLLCNINRFNYNIKTNKRNKCIKLMHSKMQDGKAVYRIGNNVLMKLYKDSRLSEHIVCDRFEETERKFVCKYLRKGDVFIDIGANIGLYTILAGNAIGPTGKIYSFEPCARTFSRLLENVQINNLKNVTCFQVAVSDIKGIKLLYATTNYWDAWNSLSKPTGNVNSEVKTEIVNTITVDEFAKEYKIIDKITMIKIDVEGWEFKVLKGAYETLNSKKSPIIILEFNKEALISAGYSCSELEKYLKEIGYKLFIYANKSNNLIPYISNGIYNINLIAIKTKEDIYNNIG